MVLRSFQRVLEVGRTPNLQRLVTLPKGWCEGVGVGKGTRVEILAGRILVIAPPGTEKESATVLRLLREGVL